jgi:hypothetical protein
MRPPSLHGEGYLSQHSANLSTLRAIEKPVHREYGMFPSDIKPDF